MVKKIIFSDKEIRFLAELKKNKVPFMIVGLTAAALQGAPVVTQDVDLWFKDLGDPGLQRALKKCGGTLVLPMGNHPPVFAGKHVELFDIVTHMHGLKNFPQEIRNALRIKLGKILVPVLKLDRIIKSKQFLDRPKDRLVLPVLKDALLVQESKRKR